MLGPCWEYDPVWLGSLGTLNTSECPKGVVESSLSQILQGSVPSKYYLTTIACLGILRRSKERGKPLPTEMERALMLQAGLIPADSIHMNAVPTAFAANQRDEVRDLHDCTGALAAQPGMKQQTFVAQAKKTGGCLTPWDTQQQRVFLPDGIAPTVSGADGGGGRNPAGLLFAAGFCAGASPSAGGIGYTEDGSPTLKAGESGTNMVPSVLCLNDQGGKRVDLSKDVSGTLRSEEHGHQPLVLASQQGGAEIGEGVCPTITSAAGTSGNNQPVLFENHGVDARYTGPHNVAPTMSARYGTGGNNTPLVGQAEESVYCIVGNAIDRKPENGGNGLGYQKDLAYTLAVKSGVLKNGKLSYQVTEEEIAWLYPQYSAENLPSTARKWIRYGYWDSSKFESEL